MESRVLAERWPDNPSAGGPISSAQVATSTERGWPEWASIRNISVTQRKAVVQPHGVLDDGHWEAVAVRFRVSHSESAYPEPIKATQPDEELKASAPVVRVVDTIGAGDTFNAAFLAAQMAGHGLQDSLTVAVTYTSHAVSTHPRVYPRMLSS